MLAEIEPRLFSHTEALEQRLKLLQAEPSTLQQAAGSFFGAVATWIESMRSDETASRILRDDFVVLSLALVQSQLVEGTAEIVRAQRESLREMLARINEALPSVLRDELADESKTARDEGAAASGQ